jgi:hypothetical protein
MQTFEDRLLTELRNVVAARSEEPAPRRRRTGLRLGMAAAVLGATAAAVVAVPAFTGDEASQANAVERGPDGSITVRLVEFTHPEQVEARLRAFGVPATVDFLPFGTQCKGREYSSDWWQSEEPDSGVFGEDPGANPHADADMRGSVVARIHPQKLHPGEQVVLSVWFGKDAGSVFSPAVKKKGSVPPCTRVAGGPSAGGDGVGG